MDAVTTVEKWLQKHGLTVEAFAQAVSIRPRELTRILDRKGVPTPRDAQRIVDFTGGAVTLTELLFPEGRLGPDDRYPDQSRDTIITHDVRLDLLQVRDGGVSVGGGDADHAIDE